MSTTAVMSYEEREEDRRRFARFVVYGPREPMEPMATRAEVLEIPCATCGAAAGAECSAGPVPLHPSFLGRAFPGLRGIHTRRYLDRTGDPR
jgi:hypothetical protein